MHCLGVRQDDNHLPRPFGEGAFYGLGDMDFHAPLLGADRIAVQRIDDRIAPSRLLVVAGRQKDQHIPLCRIAFEISLQRNAMDLHMLNRDRGCAWHDIGNIVLDLGQRE